MQNKKSRKKLRARVEKVIKPIHSAEPEKAQIGIEDADHLYREIRVPNVVTDESGNKASLKAGAKVDVVIEADEDATVAPSD